MIYLVLSRNCLRIFAFGLVLCWLACPEFVSGQTDPPLQGRVILKSGGILSGKISSGKNLENGRSYVSVLKDDGSLIKLDQSRLVRKVEIAKPERFEYQRLAAKVSSVEDHRKLLEWCIKQPRGKRTFDSEIEMHAMHILKSLPNDEQARRSLGFELEDGVWIQKDQFFGEHGYTRDGTSWTPIRTAQITARQDELDEAMADRKLSLRKWLRAVRRADVTDDELTTALLTFSDDMMLPLLEAAAKKEDDPRVRTIILEGIGRSTSVSAMRKLVSFTMSDPNEFVRERALTLLGQPHYDAQAASRTFAEFFSSKQNVNIQRAAHAIGELGGTSMVGELIEVLVTTHTEKNPDALAAGRMNTTFSSNGTSGLQTGGGPQTITRVRQNDRVLNALRVLTEQNLDFDIDRWREWNIKSNTYYDIDVQKD